ncbi:YihY/virulence factor BrkB family protein [Hyphomicrobium sp.]|jgi:membrane protein|uniref:YihY/virulence factor BrkB family protein n=1 Tax=Hyphomicrobium sp. TaxID=82 RepID=UPI002FE00154
MKRYRTLLAAIYRLYEHSGFAMAGAVAFSFVVSLFPFCIFLGGLAGLFGGRELAAEAVAQLFQNLPPDVAEALAPQVDAIMGRTRIDLLTFGGFLAFFFATSAVETLRAALNGAYRVVETRSYPVCLAFSMLLVLISAASMLVLTWAVVVGPALAAQFEPSWVKPSLMRSIVDSTWLAPVVRYMLGAAVIGSQLLAFHLWLAAGKRRLADVWPGVALSVVLWLAIAAFYSYYLSISNYARFYAGLSQLMIAMIFFQVTAVIILLGAELNRGIMELKKLANGNH